MTQVSKGELLQQDIEMHFPEMVGPSAASLVNVLVVGAWRGDEIHSFLRWTNIGQIFAFEPNSDTYRHLHLTFQNNSKVHCFNMACGDYDGEAQLHKHNTESGTESLLPLKADGPFETVGVEKVKITRLDSVSELKNVSIDLFWIDVQGFELSVFQGAEDILKLTKGMYVELNGTDTPYDGAPHYKEINSFLEARGFVLAQQEMGPDASRDGGVALYVRDEYFRPAYFSVSAIESRLPFLTQTLEKKYRLTSHWLYKKVGHYLPVCIKSFLKRYVR